MATARPDDAALGTDPAVDNPNTASNDDARGPIMGDVNIEIVREETIAEQRVMISDDIDRSDVYESLYIRSR